MYLEDFRLTVAIIRGNGIIDCDQKYTVGEGAFHLNTVN